MRTQTQRENLVKLIKAARSGKYRQCKHRVEKADGSMCIAGLKGFILHGNPYHGSLVEDLGLDYDQASTLIDMNNEGKTFEELADHLESLMEEENFEIDFT